MFDIITDSACDLTLDAKKMGVESCPSMLRWMVSTTIRKHRDRGAGFHQFLVDNPSAYQDQSGLYRGL